MVVVMMVKVGGSHHAWWVRIGVVGEDGCVWVKLRLIPSIVREQRVRYTRLGSLHHRHYFCTRRRNFLTF